MGQYGSNPNQNYKLLGIGGRTSTHGLLRGSQRMNPEILSEQSNLERSTSAKRKRPSVIIPMVPCTVL